MIKVEYTGEFPNKCSGKIIVYRDGDIIYENRKHSFTTSSNIIEDCELIWEENSKIDYIEWLAEQPDKKEIIKKVDRIIGNIDVCCGGCR